MIKEYIDSASVVTGIFNSVAEYTKSKHPKQIINIYESYNSFIKNDEINNIKFVCETFGKYIHTNLNKFYIEGRISIYRLCKNYVKNFFEILKTRKDLGIKNRIILAWHKANYKTHRTTYFCNVGSYIDNKQNYNDAIYSKMLTKTINTLRVVRFLDVIPENYYKSRMVIKNLEKTPK